MLEQILREIDGNRDEIIRGLQKLIQMESSDGKATTAQEFVENMLQSMGFTTECFREDPRSTQLPDYAPYDFEYDPNAYNVAGVRIGCGNIPSMMLFAHIDTETAHYFGSFENPYHSEIRDGKIYGLGACDDKGGVAMMLYAVKYLLKFVPELPYDLCVMSILGKHGGGFGTLSALVKGYTGKNSIYLHPAETGHGFGEIKNISLGLVDLDLSVRGLPAIAHDDLSTGANAAVRIGYIATYLEEFNRICRKKYCFDFGSFRGQPSFILNIGSICADGGYGSISRSASMKIRCRFYSPLTIQSVIDALKQFLRQRCLEDGIVPFEDITIKMGPMRATPAMVDTDSSIVRLIKNNITRITGIQDFIHQYHGGSDIRLPILYGNSQCVGIGPACVLPERESGQMEWMSIEDYINGVKILASILYEYRNFRD